MCDLCWVVDIGFVAAFLGIMLDWIVGVLMICGVVFEIKCKIKCKYVNRKVNIGSVFCCCYGMILWIFD